MNVERTTPPRCGSYTLEWKAVTDDKIHVTEMMGV